MGMFDMLLDGPMGQQLMAQVKEPMAKIAELLHQTMKNQEKLMRDQEEIMETLRELRGSKTPQAPAVGWEAKEEPDGRIDRN